MRKRNRRMQPRGANCLYLENIIYNSSPPAQDEVVRLMNGIRAMYQRARDGVAAEDDLIRLGVVLNTGCVRARSIEGSQPLVDAFQEAGEALIRCEDRMRSRGTCGFDGPGILAMNAAMDLYEQLLTLSSVKQMEDAEREARRWMVANARQAA